MALTDNLISYWKLDETGSSNANDSVGDNDLTNTNVTYSSGKINNGAIFNGTSADLSGGDIASFEGIGAFSLSVWVKPTTDNVRGIIVSKDNTSGQRSWYLDRSLTSGNQIGFSFGDGTTGEAVTNNAVAKDVFTHVVVTYDKTIGTATDRLKIYFNGTSQALTIGANFSGDVPTSTSSFQIGARDTSSSRVFFAGSIDEVGIWSRALTSTEVTALYNSGNGLQYPFSLNYTLTCEVGSYSLSGIAVPLGVGLVAQVGSFILSGLDIALNFVGWTNKAKNSTTWTDVTKNTTSWTDVTKNDTTWSNTTKH